MQGVIQLLYKLSTARFLTLRGWKVSQDISITSSFWENDTKRVTKKLYLDREKQQYAHKHNIYWGNCLKCPTCIWRHDHVCSGMGGRTWSSSTMKAAWRRATMFLVLKNPWESNRVIAVAISRDRHSQSIVRNIPYPTTPANQSGHVLVAIIVTKDHSGSSNLVKVCCRKTA